MGFLVLDPFAFGDSRPSLSNHQTSMALRKLSFIMAKNCKMCIFEAIQEIQKTCPPKKRAITWHDECLLKYSDNKILHRSDPVNGIYVTNNEFFYAPFLFDQKVHQFLTQICNKAYVSPFVLCSWTATSWVTDHRFSFWCSLMHS